MLLPSAVTTGGNDKQLIRQAMKVPLLSREREVELAEIWAETGDEAALHELTASHIRLVVAMASKYSRFGASFADLLQEGNVGLMQAAFRFEPARGVRFSTYAAWWIRSQIFDYILRNWSLIRVGSSPRQKALFNAIRRLRAESDGIAGPSLSEDQRISIADGHRVKMSDVERMEAFVLRSDQSINAPVGEDGGRDWQELLVDERATPEEAVRDQHDGDAQKRWLRNAVDQLPDREKLIVCQRHLTEEPRTLSDLALELGISKERVRQLEKRALTWLHDLAG